MNLLDFVKKYFNVPNTGDTTDNQGQCVGLVEAWIDNLGLPHDWGNAKDLLADADPNSFDIIYNDPANPNQFPVPGDIGVCGSAWGAGAGHTFLILVADGTQMGIFEQNNPAGNPPRLSTIGYDLQPNGFLGWLHPKNLDQFTSQAITDQLRTARDTNWNLYQAEVTKNAQLSQNVATLQGEVIDLKAKYDKDEQTIITLKGQISDMAAVLQKTADEDKQYAAEALDAQHNLDALKGRFTTLLGLLALSPDATDAQIKSRIQAILLPHEVLVKETMPLIEELWKAAVYKRVPKVKSFFTQLFTSIRSSLDKLLRLQHIQN